MSKYAQCQTMIFKHELDAIEEIEIEYEDGRKRKFSFDNIRYFSSNAYKEEALLDWMAELNWDEVSEFEIDLYNGQKFEIDFTVGQEIDDEVNYEEDDDDEDDDEEDDY